jgi:hypothetical protein
MQETVSRRVVLAAALLALGCHFSPAGIPGAGAAGGGPDLGPAGPGDPFPRGMVSFFRAEACPPGWGVLLAAHGRTIVPAPTDGALAGLPVGTALADGEDRQHGHDGAVLGVAIADVSFVGIVGGGNGVGASGTVNVGVSGAAGAAGLPYVELLACQKMADPLPAPKPLPRGLVGYFDGACPGGWSAASALVGRYLVGLPDGGTAGAAFGGPSLHAGELRTHSHAVDGSFATTPKGIALASGCCGSGYARNGSYAFSGASAEASAAPPYLPLIACTVD